MASSDEGRRDPSSRDAAHVGEQIDQNYRDSHLQKHEAMLALQEIGYPEQVEPPNGIGDELAKDESPCLTVPQQFDPRDGEVSFVVVTANIRQLLGRAARMLFRLSVDP